MTDLEKHWDDLPVGPAPVDAILREAAPRRRPPSARRRPEARLKRSLAAVAVLGGIAAAFVAGTLVADPVARRRPARSPSRARRRLRSPRRSRSTASCRARSRATSCSSTTSTAASTWSGRTGGRLRLRVRG